ncbi:Eco57I restriction-modification methylase domain-containing protein [Candidatus Bipolaricaulota bacterium]|nr:Eco57I restriction-modification methylase domain-containing protein [Candidatus Bipolaricaulota bacterium]
MDVEKLKEALKDLIGKYESLDNKRKRSYNEANVRKDFIDPLFEAFGWNVRDSREYDSEKHSERGYVDIALKIDDKPVIYIEAKRFNFIPPREKQATLYGDVPIDWTEEERQVLNYAGRDKVKWAILTNFEKFRLFNAYTGEMVLDIESPKEYLERIDDLILLSKDNVKAGEIEKLSERIERPDIDEKFLKLLRHWRILIANEIYKKFPDMSFEDIKFYSQRIIDRMIVIRYAEDKWVLDKPDQLKRACDFYRQTDYADLSSALLNFFDGFDKIHNTKLFEKDEKLDKILKKMDDEVLAKIIDELYLQSFRKFKSDILGNTYEAYLGTKLTKKDGRISIESADEARKKMGIYYTPTHVVEYIIENTVEVKLKKLWNAVKKLFEKGEYSSAAEKFKEIEDIKVLDLACGSGTFLIKAYDHFQNYYKKYQREVEKAKNRIKKENTSNQLKITGENPLIKLEEPLKDYERKILKKNLYGVDLDESAAEIASINLMLKALKRGEKLPLILEENIKVGNSIVTGVEGKEELLEHKNEIKKMILLREKIKKEEDPKIKSGLEEEYQRLREKIEEEINENLKNYFKNHLEDQKPFNFELEFPEIFYTKDGELKEDGGFDVIIGNPPYVRQEKIKNLKKYLEDQYTCYSGRADLYIYFIERALKLLKKGGLFSYITSNKYTRAKYGQPLRKWILKNYTIKKYRDYTGEKVFEATVDPAVIVIENKKPKNNLIKVDEEFNLPQKYLTEEVWAFRPEIFKIKKKIEEKGKPLKEWDNKIYYGIKTGCNEAFIIDTKTRDKILENCKTKDERKRTKELIRKILKGEDIGKYSYKWNELWVILAKFGFYKEAHLYPSIVEHLSKYKDTLKNRGQCRYTRSGKKMSEDYPGQHHWLELDNNPKEEYLQEFEKEKIIWSDISEKPSFYYDTKLFYSGDTTFFMTGTNLKYLTGVLNSKISHWYLFHHASSLGKALRYKKQYVECIPVPPITEENHELVKEIEEKVDRIIKLKEKEKFILDLFEKLLENTGQKRSNISLFQYLELKDATSYSINFTKTDKYMIDDEKMGIPRYYKVKGRKDSIIVSVGYIDSQTENIIQKDISQIYFDDPRIKEFFHLAITSQENDKNKIKKGYRSQKKILETTLEDIKIPRSTKNKEKDRENILGLMQILKEEYEKKFGEFQGLWNIREEIKEVDKEIDELVYKIYDINEDEKRIIEETIG